MNSTVIDMMKYKMVVMLMFFAFAKATFSQAQNDIKQEREESIAVDEFPQPALPFIKQLNVENKRVRYYRETDGDDYSYEAKFKNNRREYSIECYPNGNIQDVEITVRRRTIDDAIWNKIEDHFKAESKRFKVTKIQRQYVYSEDILQRIATGLNDNFEISVSFKSKRKIYRKEYLISASGDIVKIRDVKRQEYDFILF